MVVRCICLVCVVAVYVSDVSGGYVYFCDVSGGYVYFVM